MNPYGAPPGPPGYGPPQGGYGPPPGGYGPQPGFAPAPPPPKKSGMGGCLIAFLVVLGLFVIGGGVAGYLIYRKIGGFVGAAKDMVVEVQAATKAPGTKELRKLGCEEAVALDGKKLEAIAQRMEDEVARQQGREPKKLDDKEAGVYVYCKNNLGDDITCDQVAKTYVSAVSPDRPFVVSVTRRNEQKCSGSYSSDGKLQGEATAPEIPNAGGGE